MAIVTRWSEISADAIGGIRVLIGDLHADNYLFDDEHIKTTVQMLVQGGSIKGYTFEHDTVGGGNDWIIIPEVTDPNAYGLILIKAARALLTPHASRMSVRQPGLSVMSGGRKDTLWLLSQDAYQKEMAMANSDAFETYQDLYSWLAANTNSKYFWSKMKVDEDIPVDTITTGTGGVYFGH